MEKCSVTLEVNGERSEVSFLPHRTLFECGARPIFVDGASILSCLALAIDGPRLDSLRSWADALSGNLCRSTGYLQLVEAVERRPYA